MFSKLWHYFSRTMLGLFILSLISCILAAFGLFVIYTNGFGLLTIILIPVGYMIGSDFINGDFL